MLPPHAPVPRLVSTTGRHKRKSLSRCSQHSGISRTKNMPVGLMHSRTPCIPCIHLSHASISGSAFEAFQRARNPPAPTSGTVSQEKFLAASYNKRRKHRKIGPARPRGWASRSRQSRFLRTQISASRNCSRVYRGFPSSWRSEPTSVFTGTEKPSDCLGK